MKIANDKRQKPTKSVDRHQMENEDQKSIGKSNEIGSSMCEIVSESIK